MARRSDYSDEERAGLQKGLRDYDGGGLVSDLEPGERIRLANGTDAYWAGGNRAGTRQLQPGDAFSADQLVSVIFGGGKGASPDPMLDLEQFLKKQGRAFTPENLAWYQQNHQGLPYRFNPDGTVTYDPSAQANKFSYEAPGPLGGNGWLIPLGLAGAGLAYGALGGAGAAAGDFTLSGVAPEMVAGQSFGAPTAGEIGSFLNTSGTLGGAAASAVPGVGAATGATAAGPLSSLADMASVLGSGGSLATGGLGAVGSALGSGLAGGGTSGLGAVTDILQTGGQGALTTGTSGLSPMQQLLNALKPGPSSLANLLGGNGSTQDWLSVLGTLGATGLGAFASDKQSDALKDIANQARNDRLPALNAFNSALSSPDTFYSSAPAMGAVDSVLRKLSAQHGNPANSPTALSQAAAYNLGGYNDYLRTTGNLGLSGQDSTIRAQTNAALGDTNFYNSLGAGLQQLTQPRNNLLDSLSKFLA